MPGAFKNPILFMCIDTNKNPKPAECYTIEEVRLICNKMYVAVNKFNRQYHMALDDIYISIPYNLQQAIGQLNGARVIGQRPERMWGCPVIPAHEDRVTVFFDEWQTAEVEPIHITIN
jgi:hypothetical protein